MPLSDERAIAFVGSVKAGIITPIGREEFTSPAHSQKWLEDQETALKAQGWIELSEDSAVGFYKWLPALWRSPTARKASAATNSRAPLAWPRNRVVHAVAPGLALHSENGGKMDGTVEADETYIGGKAGNMNLAKKRRIDITAAASRAQSR